MAVRLVWQFAQRRWAMMIVLSVSCAGLHAAHIEQVGSRLELFADDFLVDLMKGSVRLVLHTPTAREVVLKTDAPWEGNATNYVSVFRDGNIYRMYYRGLHYLHGGSEAQSLREHPPFLCYAESDDGIHWRKPIVGLFDFGGSKKNNIILTPQAVASIGGDPAHTAVFKDTNPSCPEDERYKMVILGQNPPGLYLLKSADGIRFSLMSSKPIVTEGAFDSQNVVFWDSVAQRYREYHRGFREGVRDILTSAAKSVTDFPRPQWLRYTGHTAKEHLYTNAIQPYYRAPHILMGFPARYVERPWSVTIFALPGLAQRLERGRASTRYGTAVTDAVFMTSRDGVTFHRWGEAFIRPGPRQRESWVYGDNYVAWGIVETKSHLEDAPNEISLYVTEGYWEGTYTSIRRYTLRLDGFVSVSASAAGGEIVTKPLVFSGGRLVINAETSAAGSIRVEIQDTAGHPIDGYRLDECYEVVCDDIAYTVRWKNKGSDVRPLAGRPIRLRFVLHDADLYAFQFAPYQPEPQWPNVSAPRDSK